MITSILTVLPGCYLGWGLGSNDAANVFGPPVGAGIVRYRQAVVLTAIFVMLGAMTEGRKCIDAVSGLTVLQLGHTAVAALSAAIVVHILTRLRLPVSTSQAIIGAVMGIAIQQGSDLEYAKLTKIATCWILTPFGAAAIAFILYVTLRWIWVRQVTNVQTLSVAIKYGSLAVGCYAAYNLGANNLANVTGVYVGAGLLMPAAAALIGGLAIATGVLTYSRRVMETVGKNIVPLDPFSGLVALLAEALTLHIYTQIGVPVSSSQAIVGAVVGVGLMRGFQLVNRRMLLSVLVGWLAAFGTSAALALGMLSIASRLIG